MYAGRVARCPLMSHGEHTAGTDSRTDRHADGCQTVSLRFPAERGQRNKTIKIAKMCCIFIRGTVYVCMYVENIYVRTENLTACRL